ncbi:MAG: hypothetical protein Kow0077_18090 [Anaerolineae bacterium]
MDLGLAQLNRTLWRLRWLLVIGVLALALAMPTARLRLLIVAGAGIGLALAGPRLLPERRHHPLWLAVVLLLDSLYALLVFWAAEGMPIVLVAAGSLPVVIGALRASEQYSLSVAVLLAVAAPVLQALAGLPEGSEPTAVLPGSGALLLIALFINLPLRAGSLSWVRLQAMIKTREAEAARLEAAREHARAIYEMAAMLNTNLDEHSVLRTALNIGLLGLRELDPAAGLVSVVLQRDLLSGKLRVVHAYHLSRRDQLHVFPGQAGILGEAIRNHSPASCESGKDDPELREMLAFATARSALCVPLCNEEHVYGVLLFGAGRANAFTEEQVALLMAIANQATIALQNARLYQNLLHEKERILEVEEDARRQLSRTLHDGPTQSVAAIAMHANYVRRLLERDPESVPPELQRIEELARQTAREIRHMLFTLRPLVLENKGLVAALHELASKMQETYGQRVLVQAHDELDELLDIEARTLLFHIAEEAVTNARKHAAAEHIWVRLQRSNHLLVLEVQDDGVGFDRGAVDANYDQRGSLGMITLRERAELLGGTLAIESAEGLGTRVSVTLDIAPALQAVAAIRESEATP